MIWWHRLHFWSGSTRICDLPFFFFDSYSFCISLLWPSMFFFKPFISPIRSVIRYERNFLISRIFIFGGRSGRMSSIVRQVCYEVKSKPRYSLNFSLNRSPAGSPASPIYTTSSSWAIISHSFFFYCVVPALFANFYASSFMFVVKASFKAFAYSFNIE